MKPQDDTYDVVLETDNDYRYRIYFKFKPTPQAWLPHILYGHKIPDHQTYTEQELQTHIPNFQTHFTEAIQNMKWAILNEPDPIKPTLIEFIKQI
jgi:hypothetical protein